MAQQFQTEDGNLIVPGAYAKVAVQAAAGGTGTTGVIILIGEADGGPSFRDEAELNANSFGPTQESAVVAKYQSGRVVAAFRQAVNPSNDEQVTGAPSRIIICKTNKGGQAVLNLSKIAGGVYGTLADQGYGKNGSLLYSTITQATAEVLPTTGSFTWIPPVGAVSGEIRVNGGAAAAFATGSQATPVTAATAFGVAGVTVTGGNDRTVLSGLGGPTIAVTGNGTTAGVIFTLGANPSWFAPLPQVGDTLFIPAATALSTANATLGGGYVVTAVTATTIVATKLANNAAGAVTVPTNLVATAAAAADFKVFAPITISLSAGAIVDGLGKSLTVADLTGNVLAYALSATAVTWLSTAALPTTIGSSSEYSVTCEITRQVDGLDQVFTAGGSIGMMVGYKGTTASVAIGTIDSTGVLYATGTRTGGTGADWQVKLGDYPTISDLTTFISSQTGWSAAPGTAAMGSFPTTGLDEATFNCGSTHGAKTGRIKVDAAKFYLGVVQNMSAIQQYQWDTTTAAIKVLNGKKVNGAAIAGLPATMTLTPFAGGTKGSTSALDISDAFTACEKVRANFVVPCFAQDATADALLGRTEAASAYTIDAINAALRAHCAKMAQFKRRKARQGFGAKRDTFANAKAAAQNLASYRVALAFQDAIVLDNGSLIQHQPWMVAVTAAGMQAAGFYKAVFNKGLNISGIMQSAGDFTDLDESQVEDALNAGLLVVRRPETGGFAFASDQTTYSKDNNFVFNSFQAVYISDVIALSTAIRMEKALVGQNFADMPPSMAMSALDRVMKEWMRLKLIFPTSDAPRGYKNAKLTFSGPAVQVEAEINLDTAIYFVPIKFNVQQVTQTASA
jgi:hypothetical protein